MEKNTELSILLDFYGELLTEKVRTASMLYYNDDLSLSEVAADMGITRQGVRDLIKRAENNLYSYEEKLGLYKRFLSTTKGLSLVKSKLEEIKTLINSNMQQKLIDEKINSIISLVDKLIDNE